MRCRKSSKLKSTDGSCVAGLSEYEHVVAVWDCEARNEEVLAEKAEGAIAVAIAQGFNRRVKVARV